MRTLTLCAGLALLASYGVPAHAESLNVSLEPAAAVELQMRWKLAKDSAWRPSGDTVDDLEPGVYIIELTSNDGCQPKSKTNQVRVVRGTTTYARIEYTGPACSEPTTLKLVENK